MYVVMFSGSFRVFFVMLMYIKLSGVFCQFAIKSASWLAKLSNWTDFIIISLNITARLDTSKLSRILREKEKQQRCQSSLSHAIREVQSNIHEDAWSGGLRAFLTCSTWCVYWFGSLMRNVRLLGVRFVFPWGFLFRRESSAWIHHRCASADHEVLYVHYCAFFFNPPLILSAWVLSNQH